MLPEELIQLSKLIANLYAQVNILAQDNQELRAELDSRPPKKAKSATQSASV